MPYSIDLSILDGQTAIDDLKAWRTYSDSDRGVSFDVLLGYMSPDAQSAWAKGLKGRDVTDSDLDPWRDRVFDWRGLVGTDGADIGFTAERRNRLWAADSKFRAWLVQECQPFDNFRCPSVAPSAA